MAEAIKKISVARGYDVSQYALNCFGGAGGQHACDVADELAIETVLIHPLSSLLSAYGMGLAEIGALRGQGAEGALDAATCARLKPILDGLGAEAVREVVAQGVEASETETRLSARLRYAGSDTALEVGWADPPRMRREFERAHKGRFGFIDNAKGIVFESLHAEAHGGGARLAERAGPVGDAPLTVARQRTRLFSHGAWRDANVYLREDLALGSLIDGPALVIEPHQTIVVETGWRAEITAKNHVVLKRVAPAPKRMAAGRRWTRCGWRSSTTCSCRSPSRWA